MRLARETRRAHARDHEHDGHADHARGRLGALHARRARDRRRRDEDLHGAGRAAATCSRSSSPRCAGRCRAEEIEFILDEVYELPGQDRRSSSTATIRSTRSRSATTTSRSSSTSAATSACRSALEGALKLKEISYIPTEAYSAGEMKHGPIALLDEQTPGRLRRDRLARLRQGRLEHPGDAGPRRARDRDRDRRQRGHPAPRRRRDLRPAHARPFLQAALAVVPLQLLAYRIARLRGLNVDQPRNLAKTVTVE